MIIYFIIAQGFILLNLVVRFKLRMMAAKEAASYPKQKADIYNENMRIIGKSFKILDRNSEKHDKINL